MTKIPGIGEVHDGVLERDPLSEEYSLRVTLPEGVREIPLHEILADYVGKDVRLTVSFSEALHRALEKQDTSGISAVTLDDLKD